MKIEISESAPSTPDFPAFYRDGDGDLWFWATSGGGVCIPDGEIHVTTELEDVNFYEYQHDIGMTKVHGTITITV